MPTSEQFYVMTTEAPPSEHIVANVTHKLTSFKVSCKGEDWVWDKLHRFRAVPHINVL